MSTRTDSLLRPTLTVSFQPNSWSVAPIGTPLRSMTTKPEPGVEQVQVHRVEPAAAVVLEVPHLVRGGADDGIVDVQVEKLAVDREPPVVPLEAE